MPLGVLTLTEAAAGTVAAESASGFYDPCCNHTVEKYFFIFQCSHLPLAILQQGNVTSDHFPLTQGFQFQWKWKIHGIQIELYNWNVN